jgi:hyperosmotically inducible protein
MKTYFRKIEIRRTTHMTNTTRRTVGFLGVAIMATQLFGTVNAQTNRPGTPPQKEVEKLLKQISFNLGIAGRHADVLNSLTRGPRLQSESRAHELNGAKASINAIGADFGRLKELRADALPWQQQVIDRMEPALTGMAGNATEAIERLNQDPRGFPSTEYKKAVANLYAYAGEARNLIAVNVDYAQARERLNRSESLEQRVQSELLRLPYYGVFDHLAFQIDGGQVTLSGHVSRPTLKTDAERAVRGVEGVETVSSAIEVLPLSPNDDRIRKAAYRAIYGQATLARYALNPHPPIRIIVNNGNLTLMGVVGSEMDRTVAHVQANSVPGAFTVTNNLQVGG